LELHAFQITRNVLGRINCIKSGTTYRQKDIMTTTHGGVMRVGIASDLSATCYPGGESPLATTFKGNRYTAALV
jgi:hypothetical protein